MNLGDSWSQPINFTTFTLPSVDLKTPFVEASNHVSKILEDITAFTPDAQLFADNTLPKFDHPLTLIASTVLVLSLSAITWKVRSSSLSKKLIQASSCHLTVLSIHKRSSTTSFSHHSGIYPVHSSPNSPPNGLHSTK